MEPSQFLTRLPPSIQLGKQGFLLGAWFLARKTSWSDFINGQGYVSCHLSNVETTNLFWAVRPVSECHITTDLCSVESIILCCLPVYLVTSHRTLTVSFMLHYTCRITRTVRFIHVSLHRYVLFQRLPIAWVFRRVLLSLLYNSISAPLDAIRVLKLQRQNTFLTERTNLCKKKKKVKIERNGKCLYVWKAADAKCNFPIFSLICFSLLDILLWLLVIRCKTTVVPFLLGLRLACDCVKA